MHTTAILRPCHLSVPILVLPNGPLFVLMSTAILNLLYALMAILLRKLLWTLLSLVMGLLCLLLALLAVCLVRKILLSFLLSLAG